MQRIDRKEYLDKLLVFRDKQIIKVVTGVRRCGKSTLLEIYRDYLLQSGVEERQIHAVNLEDYDFYELREPKNLHTYIKNRLCTDCMNYIFIDEVQHCKDFAQVADSLYIKNNVDLYLTGSNANMLSSEIATVLSGRYVEISMLPLSFKEYVEGIGDKTEISKKFSAYLQNGSFPYTLALHEQKSALRDYMDGIYNSIVIKDVATRHKINDTLMLESIVRFLFDNIGNPLSTKKIADTMTSNGRKMDVRTVERYISALTQSFILYRAQRYNIKGKQYLKTQEKYYAVDIGLRHFLLGYSDADIGHILENVIYLELIRRGYDVYVGKVDTLEVDFVAMNGSRKVYFQVAATVRNAETLQRELTPLQKINDHYPKFILTLDDDPEADYEGIRRINATDWLLGNIE